MDALLRVSLSSRGRGSKRSRTALSRSMVRSLSSRGRGSKQRGGLGRTGDRPVALFARARIETCSPPAVISMYSCRSLREGADRNAQQRSGEHLDLRRSLREGADRNMYDRRRLGLERRSLSSRGRGSKRSAGSICAATAPVALFARARIETFRWALGQRSRESLSSRGRGSKHVPDARQCVATERRSLREGADRNTIVTSTTISVPASLSSRGRGSKPHGPSRRY